MSGGDERKVWRKRLAAPVLAAALLAGCQTIGEPQRTASDIEAARDLSGGLADAIGRCWFAEGETAFDGYLYTPENVGGKPRILIVQKNDPTGRPALVIEPKSGTEVDVYGPLMNSTLAAQIGADIDRWRSGGTACSS